MLYVPMQCIHMNVFARRDCNKRPDSACCPLIAAQWGIPVLTTIGIVAEFRKCERGMPDEVLQGLMHGAVGHDFVNAVAGAPQREAEVVAHAQQLAKVYACDTAQTSSDI